MHAMYELIVVHELLEYSIILHPLEPHDDVAEPTVLAVFRSKSFAIKGAWEQDIFQPKSAFLTFGIHSVLAGFDI